MWWSHPKDIISLERVTSLEVVYVNEKDVEGPPQLPSHLFHAVRHSQGCGDDEKAIVSAQCRQ